MNGLEAADQYSFAMWLSWSRSKKINLKQQVSNLTL